jgi:hypothetical protein
VKKRKKRKKNDKKVNGEKKRGIKFGETFWQELFCRKNKELDAGCKWRVEKNPEIAIE